MRSPGSEVRRRAPRRSRWRRVASPTRARPAPRAKRERRAGLERRPRRRRARPRRIFGPGRSARIATGRPAARGRVPDAAPRAAMDVGDAVREVEPGDVHPGRDELADPVLASPADRADELGAALPALRARVADGRVSRPPATGPRRPRPRAPDRRSASRSRSQVGRSSQRAIQPPSSSSCSSRMPGQPVGRRALVGRRLAVERRRAPRSAGSTVTSVTSMAGRRRRATSSAAPASRGLARPRRPGRRSAWPRAAARSAARPTITDGVLLEHAQPDLLDLVAQRGRALELELAWRRPASPPPSGRRASRPRRWSARARARAPAAPSV